MSTMLAQLHPLTAEWFTARFAAPTAPQAEAWPEIAAGRHTLIAAPTGSGKTLAAFLICIDRLIQRWSRGELADGVQVAYVSPLKALSNDIGRNLEEPLAELRELAVARGLPPPPIRTAVRTGDTPAAERAAMLRRPPHILVTTPESLYLMLTSAKSRRLLESVETVIVDEIHALARDKRGSHLALSLERLAALCPRPPVRIGLSATQRPIDEIARFLVGVARAAAGERREAVDDADRDREPPLLHKAQPVGHDTCAPGHKPSFMEPPGQKPQAAECCVIDAGHQRVLDLACELPATELSAVCSHEQWGEVYTRLAQLIGEHRSTLVFVNTRRLAERVALHLRELLGDEAVASHHGSLARETRLEAEQRLKRGELRAIVATASLEMGIDIGYIDLVCQIGSPRSIAAFLQRIGRSGHHLGATPKGRLFPLTRDELLEGYALLRGVRRGRLDAIEIPTGPLDILAQQIVAATACDDWREDDLYALIRRAWPYRQLSRDDFEAVLRIVSEGISPTSRRGAYVHRDRLQGTLKARRGARLAAVTSGGAIPEIAEYRVVTEDERTFVGTVDEDFAVESLAGDVFLLGGHSWQVRYVRGGEVVVVDAAGAPPSIPFWLGEGPGRTVELSHELSELRREIARRVRPTADIGDAMWEANPVADSPANHAADQQQPVRPGDADRRTIGGGSPLVQARRAEDSALAVADPLAWLQHECCADPFGAEQAVRYIAAQVAAVGFAPTTSRVLFERFFDESGGMQLVIHAPFGARINRAWGLALRKRFCRSFDFELQAAADDNGVVLSLGPQHSFAIETLFKMLGRHNAEHLLQQALLAAPVFQVRWRWNVTRALAVLRHSGGQRVPPHLQRFRSDDLLATVFPETVGCLENHHGDVEIPDHPLVRQTIHDCLTEAMDLRSWLAMLDDVAAGHIEFVGCDTREPSPFSHQLINSNPYTFLDGAPLEERRTRAVQTRRGLSPDAFDDLARLDPAAIGAVVRDAWPLVRDADELYDALLSLVAATDDDVAPWRAWLDELLAAGRAAAVIRPGAPRLWIAAEQWPKLRSLWPTAACEPPLRLPAALDQPCEPTAAVVELVRGRVQVAGPIGSEHLAAPLGLAASDVAAACEALEGSGIVLRGKFTETARQATEANAADIEWCERRLLARIHRLTLEGLRQKIQPVAPADYLRFLARWHRLDAAARHTGPEAVRAAVALLEGFQAPASAWELQLLAARVAPYDPAWLDLLFLSGETLWARLEPPTLAETTPKRRGPLTRAAPLALLLRADLPWLLPVDRADVTSAASGAARAALRALGEQGALFFAELRSYAGLLPMELFEALRELAALGLVTSDHFAAVRELAGAHPHKATSAIRRGKQATSTAAVAAAGRWSLFPGRLPPVDRDERLTRWAELLLRRYGVVFRELLIREEAAPRWSELAPAMRRLELRGQVRGGRFIHGVGGEQFASEEAVTRLRQIRDEPADGQWWVLSAADPLNLLGVITGEPRLPATHTNTVILRDGRYVAANRGGELDFYVDVTPAERTEMLAALRLGRRLPPRAHEERWAGRTAERKQQARAGLSRRFRL